MLYDEVVKELRDSYGTKILLEYTPRDEMCSKIKEDAVERYSYLHTPFNAYIDFYLTARKPRVQIVNVCYPSWLHMFLFERQMQ